MITPKELKTKYIANKNMLSNIKKARQIISNIVQWKDNRILVIVWPCSIHNTKEWLEYAKKLAKIKIKYPNLFLVMRTYFEKPRTTIGWKWLINDPDLNWSFDINKWIMKARKFLLDINELWLPTATEFLDNMTIPDISDLVSWWAIWARTTESQLHREMSSWLPMPIWFKNSTNWDIDIAIDAIISSQSPHNFIWINDDGKREIFNTKWNPNGHIILRWWKWITNYDNDSVSKSIQKLDIIWIKTWIMIDASHANSNKNHINQIKVIKNISSQIASWNKKIIWVMIESNINEWAQSFNPKKDDINDLIPGVSITDKCISLIDTEKALELLNLAVWNKK